MINQGDIEQGRRPSCNPQRLDARFQEHEQRVRKGRPLTVSADKTRASRRAISRPEAVRSTFHGVPDLRAVTPSNEGSFCPEMYATWHIFFPALTGGCASFLGALHPVRVTNLSTATRSHFARSMLLDGSRWATFEVMPKFGKHLEVSILCQPFDVAISSPPRTHFQRAFVERLNKVQTTFG
jgi:hypothetical protein